MRAPRQRGFTMVELLVVIGIIVVLMAILFPVFSVVKRRARETQCRSNLHQLAIALKEYRADHGRFPSAPWYDAVAGRYRGGFSDLYPDYIDSTKLMICPDDVAGRRVAGNNTRVYCSYNGKPQNPADPMDLIEVYYNFDGYDVAGAPPNCTSSGVNQIKDQAMELVYRAAVLSEFQTKGLTWRDAPRLANRSAPGFAIISHCIGHRGAQANDPNARDFVLRLDGDVKVAPYLQLGADPDGAGPKVAPWISQLQ